MRCVHGVSTILAFLLMSGSSGCRDGRGDAQSATPAARRASAERPVDEHATARAVFAGGCFWCVEAVFEELDGVQAAVSGYAGGSERDANYKAVCTGRTGHAEAVEIQYNPAKISYEKLLAVHFATHDPTTKDRQGNDKGTQYRSAIFYANEQEKETAERVIARLNDSDAYGGRAIVTTLEPLTKFYPAEQYHQNYVCDNPYQSYVMHVAMPKVEKVRKQFKDDLKKDEPARSDPTPASGDAKPMVSVYVYDEHGDLVGPVEQPKVVHTEAEWQRLLTPEQYRILRRAGTEAAFCGTLLDNKKEGVYVCAACSLPLFSSDAKFTSGTGWPSFYAPVGGDANVGERTDTALGMVRTEILCNRCDGHLGHVFTDGPRPTGLRYCLNSESLRFVEKEKIAADLGGD